MLHKMGMLKWLTSSSMKQLMIRQRRWNRMMNKFRSLLLQRRLLKQRGIPTFLGMNTSKTNPGIQLQCLLLPRHLNRSRSSSRYTQWDHQRTFAMGKLWAQKFSLLRQQQTLIWNHQIQSLMGMDSILQCSAVQWKSNNSKESFVKCLVGVMNSSKSIWEGVEFRKSSSSPDRQWLYCVVQRGVHWTYRLVEYHSELRVQSIAQAFQKSIPLLNVLTLWLISNLKVLKMVWRWSSDASLLLWALLCVMIR